MTYLDLVLSGLCRGFADTLPIGSSTLDAIWRDKADWLGGAMDPSSRELLVGAADLGIIPALLISLRGEIGLLGMGVWRAAKGRSDGASRLVLLVLLAAAPMIVADLFPLWPTGLGPLSAGILSILLGLALFVADRLGVTVRDMDHLSAGNFGLIGVLQGALSLVGLAPSATPIVAARLLGCERDQATRLTLLILIPHFVFNATALLGSHPGLQMPGIEVGLAAGAAFLSTLVAVNFLLAWVRRRSYGLFALIQAAVGLAAVVLAVMA